MGNKPLRAIKRDTLEELRMETRPHPTRQEEPKEGDYDALLVKYRAVRFAHREKKKRIKEQQAKLDAIDGLLETCEEHKLKERISQILHSNV